MTSRIFLPLASLVLLARPLSGGECGYAAPGTSTTNGIAQLNYVIYNAPSSALNGALGIWNEGCGGQGYSYPSLTSSSAPLQGPGLLNITVSFQSGTSTTQSCGDSFMQYDTSGALIGGSIIIYEYQVKNGVQTPCNSVSNFDALIAHELGHSLGLYDTYRVDPNSCLGAIMSSDPEYVFFDECQIIQANFTTPGEMPPPPLDPTPDQCGGFDWVSGCSPIVINFASGAYDLTGAEDPVLFDIAASGAPRWIGWTAAEANEAFLALDRDADGQIRSGAELFGTATPMKDGSSARNGFEALRELDDNGDGVIDESDAIWSRLLLWRDLNHNGISESDEISTVVASDLRQIKLDYHWAGRRDKHGNTFKYEGQIEFANPAGQTYTRPVYDIFFVPVMH